MDENCVVKKKHTKKTARLYINAFVNKKRTLQKTKKMRADASTKINAFVNKHREKTKRLNASKKINSFVNKYRKKKMSVDAHQIPEIVKTQQMYNPAIKLYFYSGSKNSAPGKGARETIPDALAKEYSESLKEFPDFRKMLSNFGEGSFRLDGLEWNTVEHYYQGSKFKLHHPAFYRTFSADSGSDLSKDPNMAKAYGGKTGKFRGKQGRDKSIQADPDFFKGRIDQEMYDAQFAKFTQNPEMRKMLLATKDAQLFHTLPRSSMAIPFDNLVYIRDLMKRGLI
jgi:predicted NAD-dependent protein-ADP-ribosyltransferase YbiA (DUF1768 family)